MASRMSCAARSVGRPAARPSRTRRREARESVRAWTWRWFVTSVVSLSPRRSRWEVARMERKSGIPEPVFAEIGMIGTSVASFSVVLISKVLMPLLSSSETI